MISACSMESTGDSMFDLLWMLPPLLAVVGLAYGAFLCFRSRKATAELSASLEAADTSLSLPKSDWDLLRGVRGPS